MIQQFIDIQIHSGRCLYWAGVVLEIIFNIKIRRNLTRNSNLLCTMCGRRIPKTGGEKMHINLKSAIHPQCNFVVMILHRIADVSQCDIFFYYSHIGQRPPPFPPPTCEEIKLYLLWLRNVFPQMKSFSHQFSFLRVRKTFLGSCWSNSYSHRISPIRKHEQWNTSF